MNFLIQNYRRYYRKNRIRGDLLKCNDWISGFVKGKTFADIGGLWGTVNEKVTVAAKAGLSEQL